MKRTFQNPNVVGFFRFFYDTECPLNMFDRFRGYDEALQYKYLISIDGETAAWKRPEWIMASQSVLMKTTTKYYQWYYDGLVPWLNYIPIRPDLTDVEEKLNWARNNDHIVRQITKNANMFAQAVFNKQAIQNYLQESIVDYAAAYSVGPGLDNMTPEERVKSMAVKKVKDKQNRIDRRNHTILILCVCAFFAVIGFLQFRHLNNERQR